MTDQLVLDVPVSIAERYATWRKTPEGIWLYAEIERRALALSNSGVARIEINRLFADLRAEKRVALNNDYRSPMARELVFRHPLPLGRKIHIRAHQARKDQAA